MPDRWFAAREHEQRYSTDYQNEPKHQHREIQKPTAKSVHSDSAANGSPLTGEARTAKSSKNREWWRGPRPVQRQS